MVASFHETQSKCKKIGGYLIINGCYNGRLRGAQGALSAQRALRGALGQSQQRRPHLPFNFIWRCNVWVPEWKDHPGGPISRTSRWTLPHGPSNALWPIKR